MDSEPTLSWREPEYTLEPGSASRQAGALKLLRETDCLLFALQVTFLSFGVGEGVERDQHLFHEVIFVLRYLCLSNK